MNDAESNFHESPTPTPRDHSASRESGSSRDAGAAWTVVITGKLLRLTRGQIADRLTQRGGGAVERAVTRRTTHVIVGMGGWPLLADGQASHCLLRAEALQQGGQSIEICSELDFAERLGVALPADDSPKTISRRKVARTLGLPEETLRRWEQLSLVRSKHDQFDFQDIVSLQRLAELFAQGATPETIHRSLERVRRIRPDARRPLAQLAIIVANRQTLLAEFGEYLVGSDGQLRWRFAAGEADGQSGADADSTREERESHDSSAAGGISLWLQPAEALEAEEWLRRAERWADEDEPDRAAAAIRKALLRRSNYPAAYRLLGDIEHGRGNTGAAMELWRVAAMQLGNDADAWLLAAEACEELGRAEEAIDALQNALAIDPAHAASHLLMAMVLEQIGRTDAATDHWRRALEANPPTAAG